MPKRPADENDRVEDVVGIDGIHHTVPGELGIDQRHVAFTEDNDPYRERDFGAVELKGERYFWKIDYYDRSLRFGAEDPSDTTETMRVLQTLEALALDQELG